MLGLLAHGELGGARRAELRKRRGHRNARANRKMARAILEERFQQFEDTRRLAGDITNIATRADDIRAVEESLCVVETIFNKVNKGIEGYQDACDRKCVI